MILPVYPERLEHQSDPGGGGSSPHRVRALSPSARADTSVCDQFADNPAAYHNCVTYGLRSGFAIAEKCSPQRLFLVDDVYTTGARINSAAVALADGGHETCGALVMARRINPDYQPAAASFWEHQSAQPFDWSLSPVVNRR